MLNALRICSKLKGVEFISSMAGNWGTSIISLIFFYLSCQ